MGKYKEYTTDDFIQDLNFRQWVLNNTPDAARFWDTWCAENPEKSEDIAQARIIVKAMDSVKIDDMEVVSESEIEEGISRIISLTAAPKQEEAKIIPLFQRPWLRVAASVALLIMAGLWWFNSGRVGEENGKNAIYTEGVVNNDTKPMLVKLPDGSTVVLEKNSEVRYKKDFAGQLREVKFKGEGLFDVVKNAEKPFLVYAGDVTTKVLGTSFVIKTFDKDSKVTVDVIRGKVAVMADKKEKKTNTNEAIQELILTPNQKAVFTKTEEKLERTLSEKPIVIENMDSVRNMIFDETPVTDIFEAIEKAYGVDVVYNKEVLKNCALTLTFEEETLYQKLNVICKQIGATYKVVDVQVIIEGKSCK